MPYPPRLGHLLTRAELVARLTATYARAHEVDHDVAAEVLDRALRGRLRDDLLSAVWSALRASSTRLSEELVLDRVARVMTEASRPSKAAPLTPSIGAALVLVDLEAGEAGESARRLMETEAGRAAAAKGMVALGEFLAKEATRRR